MPTVFLIDDDPGVRRSLSRVLREEGFDVRGYESAEAFLARPDTTARGCLVLDVTMPGLDGLELQRRLSQDEQAMPIVFLTGYGDIPMSVRAIKAGAADFLTKPVASEALVAAVRAAIEQDSFARQAENEAAELARRFGSLTARECEVLAALVDGKLNKQIAADLGVVEQTIKFHRARIMERMGARTLAELMHMAAKLRVGSAMAAQPAPPGRSHTRRARPARDRSPNGERLTKG
jgi:FixJ family two-component response regulator